MKRILTILLLFTGLTTFGQTYTNTGNALQRQAGSGYTNYRFNLGVPGFMYFYSKAQSDSASATSASVRAFTVSSIPTIGQSINAGSPDSVFRQLFAQTQAPTATLTGGTTFELSTTNETHNLSFSYGRLSATTNIVSAVISPGSLNVFSTNPSAPGTISGTQSVTSIVNTNTTYTITVTTSDSKTATATTTDTWLPGRYWGRSSGVSPTTGEILAVAGGGKQLSSSVAGTFTITASGSNRPFFAYPLSEAVLTSIKDVNGFEVISAFNITTISLTNVKGYTQTYRIYTLNTGTSSNYQITTQ